jgi:hypothetical protein
VQAKREGTNARERERDIEKGEIKLGSLRKMKSRRKRDVTFRFLFLSFFCRADQKATPPMLKTR